LKYADKAETLGNQRECGKGEAVKKVDFTGCSDDNYPDELMTRKPSV